MSPALRRSIPALLAVTGVAIVALLVARRQPDWALVGSSGGRLAFALAGVVVRLRGADLRSGGLLLIAAGAWLIAEWNNPGALGRSYSLSAWRPGSWPRLWSRIRRSSTVATEASRGSVASRSSPRMRPRG
jgi:hypothetical protein